MKITDYLVIVSLILLTACEKDDFQYSFEKPSKLLVAIRENNQLVSELKYDSLNRLIQLDRYTSGDPDCISQFYNYDSDNRLISKAYGEYIEYYEYNDNGSLKAMTLTFKSARDGYEWELLTKFQYSRGRISKGIIFSRDGVESGSVYYKYDSRGNTIERTEYSASDDYKGTIMSQSKFTYDDKINPCSFTSSNLWRVHQTDIIQGNNPTSLYYYNINMSSLPPQFELTYEYDNTNLPIIEYRQQIQEFGSPSVFVYEYREKIEKVP